MKTVQISLNSIDKVKSFVNGYLQSGSVQTHRPEHPCYRGYGQHSQHFKALYRGVNKNFVFIRRR